MKTILGAVLVTIATTSACAQDIIGTWRYIDDIVKILYYSSLYTTNFIGPLSYQAFSFLKLRALS